MITVQTTVRSEQYGDIAMQATGFKDVEGFGLTLLSGMFYGVFRNDEGGSDESTTIVSPNGQTMDLGDFNEVRNPLTARVKGIIVLSKVGSGRTSWFYYEDAGEGIPRNVNVRREDQGFASTIGDVMLFRECIRDNYDELCKYTDKHSRICSPINIDWDEKNEVWVLHSVPSIRETLDRLLGMTCAWVSLQLVYAAGPLMDRIRELMGVDNDLVLCNTDEFLTNTFVRRYRALKAHRTSKHRPDMLLAVLENELTVHFGATIRVHDVMTKACLYHIAYLLKVDMYLIHKSEYIGTQQIVKSISSNVSSVLKSQPALHSKIMKTLMKRSPKYVVAVMGDPANTKKKNYGCANSRNNEKSHNRLVFVLSGDYLKVGHIEVEADCKIANKYALNVCASLLINPDKIIVRGEHGMQEVHSDGRDEVQVDDQVLKYGVTNTEPYYSTSRKNRVSTCGNDPVCRREVKTTDELVDLFMAISKHDDQAAKDLVLSADEWYIHPTAYESPIGIVNAAIFDGLDMAKDDDGDGDDSERKFPHFFTSLWRVLDEFWCALNKSNGGSLYIPANRVAMNYVDHFKRTMYTRNKAKLDHQQRVEDTRKYNAKRADEMEKVWMLFNDSMEGGAPAQVVQSISSFAIVDMLNASRSTKIICGIPAMDIIPKAMLECFNLKGTPLLERTYKNGVDQHNRDRERLSKMKDILTNEDLAILEQRVKNGENEEVWMLEDLKKCDVVLDTMECARIHCDGRYVLGDVLLNRIRGIDSPAVELGKAVEPRSFEKCCIPVSYDAKFYTGGGVWLYDVKSQYPMIAMGGANHTMPLDYFGMYPVFTAPRNPSSQSLDDPVLSYLVQTGTIDFDPSAVDIEGLRRLTIKHSRHGSNLYRYLTAKDGPKVISSCQLICWTMDILGELKMEQRQVEMIPKTSLSKLSQRQLYVMEMKAFSDEGIARYFQKDILKLQTARFEFDVRTRRALWSMIRKEQRPFMDRGLEFVEQETEFGHKIGEVLSHSLVVPNDHVLLSADEDGMIHPSYGKADFVLLKQTKKKSRLMTHIRQSIGVFQLYAMAANDIRRLQGVKVSDGRTVTKADVKMTVNRSIGTLREHGRVGLAVDTDVSEVMHEDFERDGLYVDPLNPNEVLVVSELVKSSAILVGEVAVKLRSVRMTMDSFRDYIVFLGSRQMEVIATSLSVQCLRMATDSIMVQGYQKEEAEILFARYTMHNTGEYKIQLPSRQQGYSVEYISADELKRTPKYTGIIEGETNCELRAGMYDGVHTAQASVSKLKKVLDNPKWNITKESDLMMMTYIECGRPFLNDLPEDVTPEDLVKYVLDDHPEDMKGFVRDFRNTHEKNEMKFVVKQPLCVKGAPGTGKTRLGLAVSKYFMDQGGRTMALAPFHALRKDVAGGYSDSMTYHSFAGGGISIGQLKDNPIGYLTRTTGAGKNNTYMNPVKQKPAMIWGDELQSVSKHFEETIKILPHFCPRVYLTGDDLQMACVHGDGMELDGSVVGYVTGWNMYIKDIEYRNRSQVYLECRKLTRQGDVHMYLHRDMCDHIVGGPALNALKDKIINISQDILQTGTTNKLIACQNRNVASLVVQTVVRLLVIGGIDTSTTLIHLAGGKASADKEDVEEEELEEQYDKRDLEFMIPKMKRSAHDQRFFGTPLVFAKGVEYIVIKGFTTHYAVEGKGVKVYQTAKLVFHDSMVGICDFVLKKKKEKREIKILRFKVQGEEEETYVTLTEFEAATYLMYPFVAQQVSLIGLTLDDVTMLQVACSYVKGDQLCYNRTYEPMDVRMKQVQDMYGEHAPLTSLCRQFQVILTRVKTNQRTTVLDVDAHVPYTQINYRAMTGMDCNGLCALFTVEDRLNGNHVKNTIINLKRAIEYRKWKVTNFTQDRMMDGSNQEFVYIRNNVLDFPRTRLEPQTFTPDVILNSIMYSNKRKA